jgi:two-component system NtrC family sensor kinase
LDVIEESALRCKKINQSLLDFSHASKGKFVPLSVNTIVEEVTTLIEHEFKLQNIIIEKKLFSDAPLISGDSQLLQQVVFDLMTNARWAVQKKSGKEGGRITLETFYEADKKKVGVLISDTGVGIPAENLEKIFEPFFTTKTVGEGTGLGLSIVYNIVKAHKGLIEVTSEAGKGTAFKISLPCG